MLWGMIQVLVTWWCLATGATGQPGQSVMGGLYWCNTMCVCHSKTQVEVECFERIQMYDLLGFNEKQKRRLDRINFSLESKFHWCNDLCLCHRNNREFQCIEEDTLTEFITDTVGDMYFYDADDQVPPEENTFEQEEEEEEVVVAREEEIEEAEHSKRAEKRRNRKNRKTKKNARLREDDNTTTTTTTSPEPEPVTSTTSYFNTTTTPLPVVQTTLPQDLPLNEGEEEEEEEMEEEAEMLPKQEAVAASPAVTALQPPTRRQPFPTSATAPPPPPHASSSSTRETQHMPKVSPVLEVPVERKTVASEVSQDLDELGSTVLQIKNDVVLNQRILLVTVAVAGIAMLGVLILAVHGCSSSRRSRPRADSKKRDGAKDDNHVTKVNLEEAW